MRIMSLSELVAEYRHEARLSENTAHGTHVAEREVALLRRVQEQLYNAHEWPNLRITTSVVVPAGQRYTAFPTGVAAEGVRNVFAKSSGADDWFELDFGIRTEDYNFKDSDADETDDWVRRWRPHQDLAAEQPSFDSFEIWPIPALDTTIRFEAKRALTSLVDRGTDRTTLDGPLIALYAAAETLAANKAEDVPLKIQAAQARLDNLEMKATPGDNRRTSMLPGVTRHSHRHAPSGRRFRIKGVD